MYRITWHNTKTGGNGDSPILYSSREQAEDLARQADRDYPEILHMIRIGAGAKVRGNDLITKGGG